MSRPPPTKRQRMEVTFDKTAPAVILESFRERKSTFNKATNKHTVLIKLTSNQEFTVPAQFSVTNAFPNFRLMLDVEDCRIGFMDLPPELRIMVYKQAFLNNHRECKRKGDGMHIYYNMYHMPVCFECNARLPTLGALLMTSKVIRKEATPVFYAMHDFGFGGTKTALNFGARVGSNIDLLRNVTLLNIHATDESTAVRVFDLFGRAKNLKVLQVRAHLTEEILLALGMGNYWRPTAVEGFLRSMVDAKNGDKEAALGVLRLRVARGHTGVGHDAEGLEIDKAWKKMREIVGIDEADT